MRDEEIIMKTDDYHRIIWIINQLKNHVDEELNEIEKLLEKAQPSRPCEENK